MIFPFDVIQWFGQLFGSAASDITKPIKDFFASVAGQLAAGLEAAGLSILKDIWDVIVGPVEITAGVILLLIAFGIAFRNDIAGVAMLAMR